MRYLTKQEMLARFGEETLIQLTDREANLCVVNDAVLNGAIDDAGAEINSYLAARYQLPLTELPSLLKTYCADIARYKLYNSEPPEIVVKRYDDAIKFLNLVAKGTVRLGLDVAGNLIADAQATQAARVKSSSQAPVFNATSLGDY